MAEKNKWYCSGLHFQCQSCGNCCSGPQEGFIWVTKTEVKLIADFLGLPVQEIRKKFIKRYGFRLSITEQPGSKDCIFLKGIKDKKLCEIYPVRPNQCRTWPFWPANLESPDDWNTAAVKCPGINKGKLYSFEEIEGLTKQKNWWNNEKKLLLTEKVSEIYNWLDKKIASNKNLTNGCKACGRCCDFKAFDHILFVTTPEMMFFKQKLNSKNIKQMTSGVCPYNENGKCSVYQNRFAGCRIFFCKSDKYIQYKLGEQTLSKFKSLCLRFDTPYIYCNLQTALNETISRLD